jgi:hypothetical protein
LPRTGPIDLGRAPGRIVAVTLSVAMSSGRLCAASVDQAFRQASPSRRIMGSAGGHPSHRFGRIVWPDHRPTGRITGQRVGSLIPAVEGQRHDSRRGTAPRILSRCRPQARAGHARRSATVEGDVRLPVIRTIGHGTRTTAGLAALLSSAGVATLIDVRRYPMGRRQPHLSRERLALDLPERGIAYEWWGEALGGRRSVNQSVAPGRGWRQPAFAAYSVYTSSPAFRDALAELELRARAGEALAVMCAETVWWRCHRRLIADALMPDGFDVEHLIDRVPGRRHRPSGPG